MQTLNTGNPRNDWSIGELADLLVDALSRFERWRDLRKTVSDHLDRVSP